MKRIIAGVLLAGSLSFLGVPAFASGSIAVNKHDPIHFGIATNRPDSRKADEVAVGNCNGQCEVVYRFEHTCAAIASEGGRDGGYGYAHGRDEEEAKRAAMHECERVASHCVIRTYGCDQ